MGSRKHIRLVMALALVGAVAGCSAGQAAENRYHMAERNNDKPAMCKAATEAADAYLQAGNEQKYRLWTAFAHGDCYTTY